MQLKNVREKAVKKQYLSSQTVPGWGHPLSHSIREGTLQVWPTPTLQMGATEGAGMISPRVPGAEAGTPHCLRLHTYPLGFTSTVTKEGCNHGPYSSNLYIGKEKATPHTVTNFNFKGSFRFTFPPMWPIPGQFPNTVNRDTGVWPGALLRDQTTLRPATLPQPIANFLVSLLCTRAT